jgi:asparagine synthase (glutamine-hydrolysing)
MCGIYGIFGRIAERPVDCDALQRMGDSLAVRGPDGGGVYTAGPLGIGMRRLSIIDLDTGDQPLANEDASLWVVLNGEIYNYRELTSDLVARGHRFATKSDTEVLVHLYEEHGERFVERLRGMFAFALWDERQRTLLLARDRLGIKPLYYVETPQGLVFGSELKALLQCPWVPRQIDAGSLQSYLRYGYVPDPGSIFHGVQKVPAGCAMMVREGLSSTPQPYWDAGALYREDRLAVDEHDASDALWENLSESVRFHMVSDVPVGAFLSGGVDSSAIVSIMTRESRDRIKTFSVGFREDRFNELPYARRVAEHFGTEHHELRVEPADLGILENVLAAFDEPFADASAIPTFLVARLAREHVKVVLSGDGGDELFAGYDRYLVDHRRRYADLIRRAGLTRPLRALSGLFPEGMPGKNYAYNLSLSRSERYLDAISIFPPRALREMLEEDYFPAETDPLQKLIERTCGLDPLSRLQLVDLQTNLPGDILTKVDRMTMANSLEARVPFLDHPLVEFSCRLPTALRFRSGKLKYLLKRTLRGRVPDEVLRRPKQGFGVPLKDWFSSDLPDFFGDLLGDGTRLGALGFRRQAIRELVDLYRKKRREDHCQRLWALSVLERSLQNLAPRTFTNNGTEQTR